MPPSLTTNPAGLLAYPGSKLTYTSPENFGDSTDLTRKYSLVSRPTAGQVLAWYTTKLSSYGYHPSGTLNATSAHVSQRFEDGNHYVFLGSALRTGSFYLLANAAARGPLRRPSGKEFPRSPSASRTVSLGEDPLQEPRGVLRSFAQPTAIPRTRTMGASPGQTELRGWDSNPQPTD
jgi:hypothetical protein